MKRIYFTLLLFIFIDDGQAQTNFDIFTYKAPPGFTLVDNKGPLYYKKTEGKNYCQLFIYAATNGQKDVEKDFSKNWDFFARNPSQKVGDPDTKEKDTINGWQTVFGAAKGAFNKQLFAITVSTFTKGSITYFIAAVFTDKKFIPIAQEFIAGVIPNEEKMVKTESKPPVQEVTAGNIKPVSSNSITKFNTTFDDGWFSTAMENYVKVTKAGTEVRLHFIDKAMDDAMPNTVESQEYYWDKYVIPYFTISNPQKWSGVEYPVIYFMEADAVDKKTGRQCYVAIKVVYGGGARPVVIIAPNRESYWKEFPHPNDINKMLNYNKFAVTANDIIGTWKGSGGGGVEYYNAYSGTYAGMSAVSSTDEFAFNSDGTYSSMYRSANMNNGGTQFGGQDFKGPFSVTDWSVTASNRYKGKTTTYKAQLIAVKGGYLLYMEDADNASMNYTLFKAK